MKKKEDNGSVEHVLCPVCTQEMNSTITMNSLKEPDMEKLNHTNKWSSELCPECKAMKEKGFILIGAVEAKTKLTTAPYRSGNIWNVTQEVADKLFAPYPAPASGISFIDVNVAAEMQLPNPNLNA